MENFKDKFIRKWNTSIDSNIQSCEQYIQNFEDSLKITIKIITVSTVNNRLNVFIKSKSALVLSKAIEF